MKLTNHDTSSLCLLLSACQVGGVESVVIEDGVARGINEARSFVIISDGSLPAFPQKIGLSRLSALKQRIVLMGEAVIEAKETERGEISLLDISSGRSKVQFRCTATALIKAPKQINDEAANNVFLTKDELKLVLDAIKVMGAKTVSLIIKKDHTVSFSIADANNDAFSTVLSTQAEALTDEANSVVHYYHADIFHAVMKANDFDTTTLVIGEAGTIRTSVLGHSVILLPKINEGEDNE